MYSKTYHYLSFNGSNKCAEYKVVLFNGIMLKKILSPL